MNDVFKTHGAVSWTELLTSDPEQAKTFYRSLFGWEFEEMPMEGGMQYSIIKVGDDMIGGIMKQPEEAAGLPPTWGSYITVDNLDGCVETARITGGEILLGPRDIPKVGRFAFIKDPQGAMLYAIEYLPGAESGD